jgi:hypothetical protein
MQTLDKLARILKDWKAARLISTACSLYSAVYQSECFGVRDLVLLGAIEHELIRRGYEVDENRTLTIRKGD